MLTLIISTVNGSNLNIPDAVGMSEINMQLQQLRNGLMREVQAKQETISQYEQEINRLSSLLQARDRELEEQVRQRAEADERTEGNKQLINKLLVQIEKLQQELEWYKRTYVKRSLLGTLKQKLFSK